MKIMVLPRDPNPYQSLLYEEMERLGARIDYLGELTGSHTLNLLLLPLEVTARRIGGARLIHLHWVFGFTLPGARRFLIIRGLAQVWFILWLRICRMVGIDLIWTAHNVLPHDPVFADDRSARRALVQACDLVLAHSEMALTELAALGAKARRTAVVRHGPIMCSPGAAPPPGPGRGDGPRRFLFFGRVAEYKGVDDLLAAFLGLPDDVRAHLTVAGKCADPVLRSRLNTLAQASSAPVTLRLERVPDDEVAPLLAAADVVVLPFRRVTTSGSAILALAHGRPLIVPDLPGLADLPDDAVERYTGEIPSLTAALERLASYGESRLAAMSAAASRYAASVTWQEIAETTMIEMRRVLDGDGSEADYYRRPANVI
jgi:glycosyltransferase involved in cell wall biosynthesis